MNHLFVSYEIALKLKEKGFDEECIAMYSNTIDPPYLIKNKNDRDGYVDIGNSPQHGISAILYQQVVSYLNKIGRDKHLDIYITFDGLDIEKTNEEILRALDKI